MRYLERVLLLMDQAHAVKYFMNDIFALCEKMRSECSEVMWELQMVGLYTEPIRDILTLALTDKTDTLRLRFTCTRGLRYEFYGD